MAPGARGRPGAARQLWQLTPEHTANHAFIDGNKRVGLVAAYVFLAMNDSRITAGEKALEKVVLQ